MAKIQNPNTTKCNCAEYPFSPHVPCYKVCTGNVLNYASPDELVQVFNISQSIVDKIADANLENRAQTLDDYQAYLTVPEFTELNRIFSQLGNNPAALAWLRKEMRQQSDMEVQVPVEV